MSSSDGSGSALVGSGSVAPLHGGQPLSAARRTRTAGAA